MIRSVVATGASGIRTAELRLAIVVDQVAGASPGAASSWRRPRRQPLLPGPRGASLPTESTSQLEQFVGTSSEASDTSLPRSGVQ